MFWQWLGIECQQPRKCLCNRDEYLCFFWLRLTWVKPRSLMAFPILNSRISTAGPFRSDLKIPDFKFSLFILRVSCGKFGGWYFRYVSSPLLPCVHENRTCVLSCCVRVRACGDMSCSNALEHLQHLYLCGLRENDAVDHGRSLGLPPPSSSDVVFPRPSSSNNIQQVLQGAFASARGQWLYWLMLVLFGLDSKKTFKWFWKIALELVKTPIFTNLKISQSILSSTSFTEKILRNHLILIPKFKTSSLVSSNWIVMVLISQSILSRTSIMEKIFRKLLFSTPVVVRLWRGGSMNTQMWELQVQADLRKECQYFMPKA